MEPASESSQSANDFARVPARVGARYFEEALKCVLPYLLQFEVWSVHSDFGLDPKEPATKELLELFPAQILTLISACISPKSEGHGIFELNDLLDQIVTVRPDLRSDNRTRYLRKFSH